MLYTVSQKKLDPYYVLKSLQQTVPNNNND